MQRSLPSRLLPLFLFLTPLIAFAQDGLVPCGPQGQQGNECTLQDLFTLLVNVYNFLLGMAGLVAFAFLIYGGIRMFLYSVDEKNLAAGKDTVKQAIIGLAIIACAYLVVNTLLVALGVTENYFGGSIFGLGNP